MKLQRIEIIPFRKFKEKIRIVKKHLNMGARVSIYKNYVITESEEENE